MNRRIVLNLSLLFLATLVFEVGSASAQTIAYRTTNLTSDLPNVANNVTQKLMNPWGISFLAGQPFFIANNGSGSATSQDATGSSNALPRFFLTSPSGTALDNPTGIVGDQNSSFGTRSMIKPFIVVTEEGTIFEWGPDASGNLQPEATPVFDNSSHSAVYKGVAILNSALTAPALAVTNFQSGFIENYFPGLTPVALPGSFTDPNLPSGYAPFGIQVIGNQVFVTYAVQDAVKHDPVVGAGNGIVSIFDMDGNFVWRFATGGALNAPWGVAQASANFGPFSNDILVGNLGDGIINAFDPATGNLLGHLTDGDGLPIVESGLHALAFRADGVGNPDALYFTAGIENGQDGLFGAITTGLVSVTGATAPNLPSGSSLRITAIVAGAQGNLGSPTGTVSFLDGSSVLGTAPLANGLAALDVVFTSVGNHTITAMYSGDPVFLPSSDHIDVLVATWSTTLSLSAPANAAPGSAVTLTATASSPGGIPTGQVTFLDGNTNLGSAPLDDTGVARLRVSALAAGEHSLTSSYTGDAKFAPSTSAALTMSIANPDFSFGATPASATVIAGQSTQFRVTVTPAGGFTNSVAFSCSPLTGITCTFNPAAVTPANGAASTTLTVTTSANVPRYGLLPIELIGPGLLLAALVLFWFVISRSGKLASARPSLLTATALLALVGLSLTASSCGGYGNPQPTRGTASIPILAQSGAISHTTSVNVTVQ